MAIEIVSFPIKNGDFPISYVSLPEGKVILKQTNTFSRCFTGNKVISKQQKNRCFILDMNKKKCFSLNRCEKSP